MLPLLLLCVLPYNCCCCSSSAAASGCCSSSCLGWFVAGSLNLMPVFYFSSFKQDLFLMVPLGSTVSHLWLRYAYILDNYGHVRSQGGRHPAAAKSPLCIRGMHALCSLDIIQGCRMSRSDAAECGCSCA